MKHKKVKIEKVNKTFNKALKNINEQDLSNTLDVLQKANFAYSLTRMALGRE